MQSFHTALLLSHIRLDLIMATDTEPRLAKTPRIRPKAPPKSSQLTPPHVLEVKHNRRSHHAKASKYLALAYRRGHENCDLKLIIESDSIRLHWAMIVAHSETIRYNHKKTEVGLLEITLPAEKITMQGLCLAIDYIYDATVTISLSQLMSVIQAAIYLKIRKLFGVCEDFLKKAAGDVKHSIFCLSFSYDHYMWLTPPCSHDVTMTCCGLYQEISTQEAFSTLAIDAICAVLSSDIIDASELDVCTSAIQWLTNSASGGDPDPLIAERLMQCVRFPLLSQDDLLKCVGLAKAAGFTKIMPYRALRIDSYDARQKSDKAVEKEADATTAVSKEKIRRACLQPGTAAFKRVFSGLHNAPTPSDIDFSLLGVPVPPDTPALPDVPKGEPTARRSERGHLERRSETDLLKHISRCLRSRTGPLSRHRLEKSESVGKLEKTDTHLVTPEVKLVFPASAHLQSPSDIEFSNMKVPWSYSHTASDLDLVKTGADTKDTTDLKQDAVENGVGSKPEDLFRSGVTGDSKEQTDTHIIKVTTGEAVSQHEGTKRELKSTVNIPDPHQAQGSLKLDQPIGLESTIHKDALERKTSPNEIPMHSSLDFPYYYSMAPCIAPPKPESVAKTESTTVDSQSKPTVKTEPTGEAPVLSAESGGTRLSEEGVRRTSDAWTYESIKEFREIINDPSKMTPPRKKRSKQLSDLVREAAELSNTDSTQDTELIIQLGHPDQKDNKDDVFRFDVPVASEMKKPHPISPGIAQFFTFLPNTPDNSGTKTGTTTETSSNVAMAERASPVERVERGTNELADAATHVKPESMKDEPIIQEPVIFRGIFESETVRKMAPRPTSQLVAESTHTSTSTNIVSSKTESGAKDTPESQPQATVKGPAAGDKPLDSDTNADEQEVKAAPRISFESWTMAAINGIADIIRFEHVLPQTGEFLCYHFTDDPQKYTPLTEEEKAKSVRRQKRLDKTIREEEKTTVFEFSSKIPVTLPAYTTRKGVPPSPLDPASLGLVHTVPATDFLTAKSPWTVKSNQGSANYKVGVTNSGTFEIRHVGIQLRNAPSPTNSVGAESSQLDSYTDLELSQDISPKPNLGMDISLETPKQVVTRETSASLSSKDKKNIPASPSNKVDLIDSSADPIIKTERRKNERNLRNSKPPKPIKQVDQKGSLKSSFKEMLNACKKSESGGTYFVSDAASHDGMTLCCQEATTVIEKNSSGQGDTIFQSNWQRVGQMKEIHIT